MTEDGASGGCGDHVISNRQSKRRYKQADGIVNPEAAEGCTPRTGNKLRYNIAYWVGKHREDNAADDVPGAHIQIGEPSSKKWQDELEEHQNEGQDDEGVYHQRKLRPLQRLAETGGHQDPSRQDHRKIPYAEKKPSQPAAQNRPICQAWDDIIEECQECVAEPSEEYALRMVVAKPSPGKPCVATQKFWKA